MVHFVEENGAQGRNRTSDTVIFSHMLYQLSYLGAQSNGRIFNGFAAPCPAANDAVG
jgi:hypothetical protein